jgi:hypothetical protein
MAILTCLKSTYRKTLPDNSLTPEAALETSTHNELDAPLDRYREALPDNSRTPYTALPTALDNSLYASVVDYRE